MSVLRKFLLALHQSRRRNAARELARYAHLTRGLRKHESASDTQDAAQDAEAPKMDRVALAVGGCA